MAINTSYCPKCSTQNSNSDAQCRTCGFTLIHSPMQQYSPNSPAKIPGADKKILVGILGIVLGGLGVHKFVLGYTNEGIIMLAVYIGGIFLCGIPSLVIAVIGIVEGIIYLTKSDEEFVATYINAKKGWM